MPGRNERDDYCADMYESILMLKDAEQCRKFFGDLCTPKELRAIEQRYRVAKMLHEGKVYTEIEKETSASSATISRVNRMINYDSGILVGILDEKKVSDSGELRDNEPGDRPDEKKATV